jgi:hypothetical protein
MSTPALPRWTALPGDPPALRRWLAARAGPVRGHEQDGEMPEDWPQEESR